MKRENRKIFAVSMVKNEADVIESFVRYSLRLFDGMVILDNGSTDRTVPILNSLVAEGLPVTLKHDTSTDYAQSEKMTNLLYETFQEYDPDLIMPLDADEFLISNNNRDHPRDILEQVDLNTIHHIQHRQYIPTRKDNRKELFIPRKIHHTYGDVVSFKVLVSRQIAYEYAPALSSGNHFLEFDPSVQVEAEHIDLEPLRLAHYSFRSIEQAKSKIIVGWLNTLASPARKVGDNFHWNYWYDLLKHGRGVYFNNIDAFIEDLYGGSPSYPEPIDLSFCSSIRLKYTRAKEVDAMKNLLDYLEALALEYGSFASPGLR